MPSIADPNHSASGSDDLAPEHDFDLIPHPCPHCGEHVIGATGKTGDPPRDGDILLCGECGDLSRYRSDGGAELLSAEETLTWMQDPDLAAVHQWIRWARRQGVPS